MPRWDMTLHTQIVWEITLRADRKAKHNLKISIFDYENSDEPISKTISLSSTLNEISNFQSNANGKELVWAHNLTIEVSQIAQAYPSPPPNPIIAYCNFNEEAVFFQYGEFYVMDSAYNCVDLKASSIEVHLRLPKVAYYWFCIDWIIIQVVEILKFLEFFKDKQMAGVYTIKEAEGFPKAEVLKEGRAPVLKFKKSGELDNFPRINLYFFRPVKPILLILSGFLLFWGIHRILSWLLF